MKKYNLGIIIFREVVFIVICLMMVGTAFTVSEKDIIDSNGKLQEHIHFPIPADKSVDASQVANG